MYLGFSPSTNKHRFKEDCRVANSTTPPRMIRSRLHRIEWWVQQDVAGPTNLVPPRPVGRREAKERIGPKSQVVESRNREP